MKSSKLDPTFLIIFGITGDLARKKLLPALYYLIKERVLPENFSIIGVSRRDISVSELLKNVEVCVNEKDKTCDPATLEALRKMISMKRMDLTKAADYQSLLQYLNEEEDRRDTHMNRLYYLSIPPQAYGPVVQMLGQEGHNSSCQHGVASTRLLIEKPFGYNLASAKQLIKDIDRQYGDFQVYRIDHYLAKETVQNILTFRFSNPVFEALWNRKSIDHIQIVASETLGIEGRGDFYDKTGALRDIIQSHLLQLLALATMEKPQTMTSKHIHEAKLKLLKSIVPINSNRVSRDAVRGQYDSYLSELGQADSPTETYAAVKLFIANRRWKHVPIFIRTGKALSEKATEITIVFKQLKERHSLPNMLTLRLQPDEGITFDILAKKPGLEHETQQITLQFNYEHSLVSLHPDAYERVLLDGIRGDKTLFSTANEVLAAWEVLNQVILSWDKNDVGLETYDSGSWGPLAADLLTAKYGATWVINKPSGGKKTS